MFYLLLLSWLLFVHSSEIRKSNGTLFDICSPGSIILKMTSTGLDVSTVIVPTTIYNRKNVKTTITIYQYFPLSVYEDHLYSSFPFPRFDFHSEAMTETRLSQPTRWYTQSLVTVTTSTRNGISDEIYRTTRIITIISTSTRHLTYVTPIATTLYSRYSVTQTQPFTSKSIIHVAIFVNLTKTNMYPMYTNVYQTVYVPQTIVSTSTTFDVKTLSLCNFNHFHFGK